MKPYQCQVIVLLVAALASAPQNALAQAYIYRHRSTAAGDYLSGSADVISAQGSFLLDQARAERIRVQADVEEQNRRYDQAEQELRLDILQLEFEARRAESRARIRTVKNSTRTPHVATERGPRTNAPTLAWPSALHLAQFDQSRKLIQGLIEARSHDRASLAFEAAYRHALTTEIGVTRARMNALRNIDPREREQALKFLAAMEGNVAIGETFGKDVVLAGLDLSAQDASDSSLFSDAD